MSVLYNKKWRGLWNNPKYEEIRNKILKSFEELVFVEEGHKYFLGDRELVSVSVMTHMFKEEFDTEGKAVETYERNFNNPYSKYYGMTIEDIKKAWKDNQEKACSHGTERHEFGESCFYFMTEQYDKILPEFQERLSKTEDGEYVFEARFPKEEAIVKFYRDIPSCVIPILAETKVYNVNENYAYSGTFDILFYYDATLNGKTENESGLFIMDWKTNKDLYKNFAEKHLLEPFDWLLDMPISVYKLQLSAYQLCLEKIGFKVIARRILWLKEEGDYDKINLEDLTKTLNQALIDKSRGYA